MHILFYMFQTIFLVIQVIFAFYILLPFILLVLYGLVNLFRVKTPYEKLPFLTDKEFEFALIITAHQEARFVYPLVDSIFKQTHKNYHVYIVADDMDGTEIRFPDPRVTVLRPHP